MMIDRPPSRGLLPTVSAEPGVPMGTIWPGLHLERHLSLHGSVTLEEDRDPAHRGVTLRSASPEVKLGR